MLIHLKQPRIIRGVHILSKQSKEAPVNEPWTINWTEGVSNRAHGG